MKVKQLFLKFMSGLKNAKISADLHQRLKVFAAVEGLPIGLVIEAACELGLKRPKDLRQLAQAHTTAERSKVQGE